MQSGSRAQVVSHSLEPFEEIQSQQSEAANERKDNNGQNEWRAFERFEFHADGLNEKPEQLKAALV
jgi:hypothetical protein